MSESKSSNTDAMIAVGFILQLSGQAMKLTHSSTMLLAGPYITWLGAIILIWACVRLAISKGYSGFFGLLGLFSMLGVIVLFCLPQKNSTPNLQNIYAKSLKALGVIYGLFGVIILVGIPIMLFYTKELTPVVLAMLPVSLLRAALFLCVAWFAWSRPTLTSPFAWASLLVFIIGNLYQAYIQNGHQLSLHGLITTFYVVVIIQAICAAAFTWLTPRIGNANVA